jgi:TRAP-type C4-dicarboxylate transport system permease small subunit
MRRLLTSLCGALAALALFAIMWLTLVDVSGRKLLSQSLPGSLELTELLMVAVIFAGLPLVSLRDEHIVFDSFDRLLGSRLLKLQQVLVNGLCAATLAGLAWLVWVKAGQMASYGDTTAQLLLPLGPFVYMMSVLIALTALVHGLLMFRPAPRHAHPGAGEGAP